MQELDRDLENQIIQTALLMTSAEHQTKKMEAPFQQRLMLNVAYARNAFAEDSAAHLAARSVVIKGNVLNVELEESSQRYIVEYVAFNSDGESERVRTPRVDTSEGAYFKVLAPNLKGRTCIIYKANQSMGDKGRTVRIAPCIIPLGSKER